MPWQETGPMDERVQFIAALMAGETMAEACRRSGVSRKTGYKWWARYRQDGPAGLRDRSRAPRTHPQALAAALEREVLALRAEHPTWGPKKLVATLRAAAPERTLPAPSTVGALLQRAGLVSARRRRAHVPPRTQPLAHATASNALWCADFKGQFRTGDGVWCYPLTISDAHSRYLLRCQALPTTDTARVQPLFEATFREYGVPVALRTDNGPPFASVGAGGLTALSVWWVKLGIVPERIDPGAPAQNGRHERLHRTLKAETAQPPAATLRAQQRAFDHFCQEYNTVRPHEALGFVPPATVYSPATRPFPPAPASPTYPTADAVKWVRPNGTIRWRQREVYLSQTLAGEPIGLTQTGDGQWEVAFGPIGLGCLDERRGMLLRPRHSLRAAHAPPAAPHSS